MTKVPLDQDMIMDIVSISMGWPKNKHMKI